MSRAAALAPGFVFAGEYRIVRPLSEGGMGTLYVAEQISTGRQRALKLMQPQLIPDERTRQRFIQEARISAIIPSDHVVEVIAAGIDKDSGAPWIAMELLNGEDLADFAARRGVLTTDEVGAIYSELCHALGAAHGAGIVHRDLKPENVFLASARRVGVKFEVKVLDFGIAKMTAEATKHATQPLGTPLWMAPEQSTPGSAITPAADVWSLGLIAFRLLTGSCYWLAADDPDAPVMALLREMLMQPIEPATARAARRPAVGPPLPAGFDDWFGHCVVRQPKERFRDANAAFTALESVLRAPPPAAARISRRDPMSVATEVDPADILMEEPVVSEPRRPSGTVFSTPLDENLRPIGTVFATPIEEPNRISAAPISPQLPRDRVSGTVFSTPLQQGFEERPSYERISMPSPSSGQRAHSPILSACQSLVQADPYNASACRDLLMQARGFGAIDLAWRAASVLALTKQATDDERRFAGEPMQTPPSFRRPLDYGLWRLLIPEGMDAALSEVFAATSLPLARATAQARAGKGAAADPACRVDAGRASAPAGQLFRWTSTLLQIDEPELYIQPNTSSPLTAVHGHPMACIIGGPLLRPMASTEIVFTLARYLAGFRADLYVPLFVGSVANLRNVVGAVFALSGRGSTTPDPMANTVARTIHNLTSPPELARIRTAVEGLLARRVQLDVRQALRAAEIAAARSALLLAGDLTSAFRALSLARPGEVDDESLRRELLSFWISDANTMLRQALGVARS